MTTTITGLLKRFHTNDNYFDDLHPDRVLTVRVRTQHRLRYEGDTYRVGCNLHLALRRLNDSKPLTEQERLLWPYIATLRSSLWQLGAGFLRAERPLGKHCGLHGTCDLSVLGGPCDRGIVEVKVKANMPASPCPCDLVQLGGYLRLATRCANFEKWWGGLAYVSPSQSTLTLFMYGDVRPLVDSSAKLLKAA